MNRKRVMIAAPKSGSGKTTVTCALLWIWKESGLRVGACKCGPDYIDPLFHEKIIGVPAQNLDTFFTGAEETRRLFLRGARNQEITVFEGVMGLYDGLGGVREEGSSYHLAKVTKTPIVLVVDAKGMGRSIIPLLAGFLAYDREHLIRGVLLNRISGGFYQIIAPLIEKELQLAVLGFLPEREAFQIESRHLGLALPEIADDGKERLAVAAGLFSETVFVEGILKIAESAEELEEAKAAGTVTVGSAEAADKAAADRPVIAVARDEAFCFYYADNLRMLEECGARLAFFSPLRDEELPEGCHALLLGGGYPELYAEKLSENRKMRAAVKGAAENGMPIVAECGGFLYLHSFLADQSGSRYEMAGVLPASCFYTGKSVRFGYIELMEKNENFLPKGGRIRGHEFHYYDSADNGTGVVAQKPVTGKEYSCIIEDKTRWMGFPHLYYPSNPAFVQSFVKKAKRYQKRMEEV